MQKNFSISKKSRPLIEQKRGLFKIGLNFAKARMSMSLVSCFEFHSARREPLAIVSLKFGVNFILLRLCIKPVIMA